MSVKIKNRQYENLFKHPDETENPDWLIGNTGDWITAKFDFETGIDFVASSLEPITINVEERTIKLMNGKKWGDYGFDINRTIKMTYTKTTTPTSGPVVIETELFDVVIENIYNDTLVFEDNANISSIGFELIPTDRGTVKITAVKLYDEREMEGVRMTYGNINNSDVTSHNPNSFIDDTRTEMIFVGLNNVNDNSFREMELIGLQSGMSIESARIRKVSEGINNNVTYNIEPTGAFALSLPNNWQSIGQSIALTDTPTPTAPFQNTVRQNYVGGFSPNQMFLYNSDFSGLRTLQIKIGTIIRNNYGGGNNRVLKILLHKFINGTSLTYSSGQLLKTYNVTNEIRDTQLTFEDNVTINVLEGESYSIGYAWEISNPHPFLSPSVLFETNFGHVNVLDVVNDTTYKRNYQIEVKFMLSSFFEDIQQMIERTTPQNLFNAASLTDIIDISFYPEWNNPNIITKNDMSMSERLGNTGWFNENYNGLTNNFEVKSFRYYDMNNLTIPTVDFGTQTKVKATIGGVSNLISGETKVNFGFIWIPKNDEDYKNKTSAFYKNTKINSPKSQAFLLGSSTSTTFNGDSNDNARIDSTNIIVSQVNDDLIVEFTLIPTAEFTQFFQNRDEDDRMFALWVSVCDSTLVTNFSDRVNLLLDVQQMQFNLPISGELSGVVNAFMEHPESHDVLGVQQYDGFIEDDILTRSNFQIKQSERLLSMTLGYEVENLSTQETYILEQYQANTSGFPIVNNRQEIDLNQSRGFLLPFDNNKNWVKIVRDSTADSDLLSGYTAYFGTKIRWEDWLERFNVPAEFYDPTKSHDGFNNNWLDYLTNGTNHRVNFFMYFDIEQNGQLIRYKNAYNLTFEGYDTNDNITVAHNYRDSETNTLLNIGTDPETGAPLGVVLSNKPTLLEIIYTKVSGNFDLTNVYCSTSIETRNGAGEMNHHQISSIWEHNQNGWLIPVAGQTKLKVELTSPNVIKTTCLIDNESIEQSPQFKVSGRIGCFKNNNGIPLNERKYDSSEYSINYE